MVQGQKISGQRLDPAAFLERGEDLQEMFGAEASLALHEVGRSGPLFEDAPDSFFVGGQIQIHAESIASQPCLDLQTAQDIFGIERDLCTLGDQFMATPAAWIRVWAWHGKDRDTCFCCMVRCMQ